MAWSYRKRIKIIPGVHLNISRKGISTTIGVRGASLNIGPNGTYLNTSIPGLGIYNRQRISLRLVSLSDRKPMCRKWLRWSRKIAAIYSA